MAPVAGDGPRPLLSVVVPTYECAGYLEHTLRSVLAQDPGPDVLEVVVVDDASRRDDPAEVVARVGQGRVRFVRQERNLGHVRTFNRCLAEARGHWVHLLHGDDLVLPGFYDAVREAVQARPDLAAVMVRFARTDEQGEQVVPGALVSPTTGVLEDWPARITARQWLQAPSIVVARRTYEAVGGFDEQVRGYGEDWEMWVRVAVHGAVWYDVRPLAVYRVRADSLSSATRLRSNARDMRRVLRLNAGTAAAVLPAGQVRQLTRAARRSYALALVRRANRALAGGSTQAPVVPVVEAVRTWPAPSVAARSALLLGRWARARAGA